jgi:hypothetical protein
MHEDADHRAAVALDLTEALERLPAGPVVVRTHPDLAAAVRAAETGREIVVESIPDLGSGFVAVSPETGVEIDATLEAKLVHGWPRVAVAVLKEMSA